MREGLRKPAKNDADGGRDDDDDDDDIGISIITAKMNSSHLEEGKGISYPIHYKKD